MKKSSIRKKMVLATTLLWRSYFSKLLGTKLSPVSGKVEYVDKNGVVELKTQDGKTERIHCDWLEEMKFSNRVCYEK